MHDVIIIGGSYAGLSAALQLGRTRRSVLVLDDGQRRNRFATHSHGFLTHDGDTAAAIAAAGKAEVLAYANVEWRDAAVTAATRTEGGFVVEAGGERFTGKRVILATGVRDELPAIPGLAERWGQSVFHCPYCHGYELDRGPLGVLGTTALVTHFAAIVNEWTTPGGLTLFANGAFEPDADQLADLTARAIRIERTPLARVDGDAPGITVHLADGRSVPLAGLFAMSRTVMAPPLAAQLGCQLEDGFSGPFIKTDPTKETTVPGVFACGDAANPAGAVSVAVADGTIAASAAHRSLVFRA